MSQDVDKQSSMNRYALELHAREKHQSRESETSPRSARLSRHSPLLGFLSRNMSRSNSYPPQSVVGDSMTFLYELRSDLANVDLDEALPVLK
jgi:hypothetical protein